ncbi:hypothetical protein K1719_000588 [Acacia pycnantha]|nr:hypothetical protein K1719_000588 [Acacia pycnantha]
MLIPNCLFRVGGAAILLSNKESDRRRSKYKLVHVVRTHKGADDKAFKCVYQEEDNASKTWVSLSKDLMAIVGGALKTNITTLDFRAVTDELEKNLELEPHHIEASRMTLHRFGNTSSRSICAVWKALRNVKPSPKNPWEDCIHRHPVQILS